MTISPCAWLNGLLIALSSISGTPIVDRAGFPPSSRSSPGPLPNKSPLLPSVLLYYQDLVEIFRNRTRYLTHNFL